jgi:alpha-amylase
LNHTSVEHPWFAAARRDPESPFNDYYIWVDTNPGYFGPWSQPVWHAAGDRYYYGLFWSGLPDLNLTNPTVTAELQDIARFWLDDMGVDGFRLDAVKHLIEEGRQQEHTPATLDWLADFNAFTEQVRPGVLTVGEIFSGSPLVAQYVPAGVDIAFEFNLATTMIDSVRRRSKDGLIAIQQQALDYFPQYATFLTNHDQNRVMSELRGDVASAKVAATLLLTNPGVPFVYYGEEIGMQGQKPDERIRTPMQWTSDPDNAGFSTVSAWQAPDASVTEFNVAAQTDDPDSLLSHYRRLIHLRNNSPALQYGSYTLVESSERPVYSFLRHTADEVVLVLVNLNHREISDYELNLAASPLREDVTAEWLLGEGDIRAPSVNAAGGFAAYVPLDTLPPRSSFIIRLR